MRRKALALLCVAAAGLTTGCSSTEFAIPDKFCEVPVSESSLSPLLPAGGTLKQKYADLKSRPGAACSISVDGQSVLAVNLLYWNRSPEPVNWDSVASTYKHAAKRDVSFQGDAVIGSDHAVVHVDCNSESAYMSFVFYFRGDRVEDTREGYKKLQRFVDDFVPRQTDRYDCIK
ncbi:hypothetical protein K4749_34375 [Streptomyces sp. TRM72054]|uniref:hypothetical protein n=1 Tax=Streptomyces sp. TRM72054 TaxID=2870562 RepID=UPI001C8BF1CE|nr:hypothetical protein [Streptomyces sp. TRM72054]MBX9398533.1 hypothetical protein [Streptomyces sp. TRM72054]